MSSPKNRTEKEQTIFDLTQKCKEIKRQQKELDDNYKVFKDEIIRLMQDLDIKYIKSEIHEVISEIERI
ncbi:MAG: hypothetical protein ACXABO_20260 [Promethearchaeota archaeon]|jgi:hypothetical protein